MWRQPRNWRHVFSLLSSPTRSGIQGLCFFLSLRRERHWILVDCLDPFFDWIPDQSLSSTFVIGDRGQASGTSVEDDRKRGKDDRKRKDNEKNNGAGFLLKTCSCRLGPLLCSGRISCGLPSFPFLGGLFGRHEMPPLQLKIQDAAPTTENMRCRPYN